MVQIGESQLGGEKRLMKPKLYLRKLGLPPLSGTFANSLSIGATGQSLRPSFDKAYETQLSNIQKKTGKTLEELAAIVQSSGLTKHRMKFIPAPGQAYARSTSG